LGISRRRRQGSHPAGRNRPGRNARIAITLLAIVAILAATWMAVNSPIFRLRDLRVIGNERLSDAEVARLAGLDDGANVARLSPGGVSGRLEADPWIARAEVRRTLPGTVVLRVWERRPVAALRSGGRWAVMASDGTVLTRPRGRPSLPVVEAPRAGGPSPEKRKGVASALRVLDHVPRSLGVERVRPRRLGGVVLVLPGGIRVLYGSAERWDDKNAAIAAMLRWAARREIFPGVVDVRVPQSPTLRPASPPA
jgi:cell division protein FtsQ